MVLRNGENGEVYNVGGFNEQENISIVKTIIAIIRKLMEQTPTYQSLLSIPVEAINEELITYVADRPGHDMRYAIDPEKIATKLGWYPETSFAVGIEKTVKWYLDNPEWTASVTSGSYRDYYKQMYGDRSGETLKV
jgi:dTDP-glucose 4,6-dehydratase